MAELVYFDRRRLALQQELQFHPDVVEKLQRYRADNFELILSEICSVFGIVLDGDYLPEDLNCVCEILTKKLYERRSGILVLSGPTALQ